jgi:hypothetical protein
LQVKERFINFSPSLCKCFRHFKKRTADIAWLYTDSSTKFAYARPKPIAPKKDSSSYFNLSAAKKYNQSVFDSSKGAVIVFKNGK